MTLLFLVPMSWGQKSSLCDIIDLSSCHGVTKQGRRTSALSLPSPSTAANLNPATVSYDKGIGVEAIYQNNNPLVFSLATGTGRIGGALISSSLENSFFGNRVPEMDSLFLRRQEHNVQYDADKVSLALGGKLFRQKIFALDLGLILKRHSEIKRVNPGAGLSGRLGPFTFGASYYQDDFFLDFKDETDSVTGNFYRDLIGKETYQERFNVQTYFIGTKYKSLTLDAGIIETNYKFNNDEREASKIQLYAVSYIYKNFLLNAGLRKETNPYPKFVDGELEDEDEQSENFFGLQFSPHRKVILGLNYNYFLLKEITLSTTIFL